jgi:hypothetical protein
MEARVKPFCTFAALLITGSISYAANLGALPGGKAISCEAAVKYRDQELIKEYDAIVARYADGTAERQRLLDQKLNTELAKLDAVWAKTQPALKKKVAAQWVALTLSVVGVATSQWAATRVTPENKEAVNILIERSNHAASSISSAVIAGEVSVKDAALLPVSTLVGVLVPEAAIGLAVLSIGMGVIDQIDNLAELELEKSAYQGSAEVLKAALRNLAKKSVSNQLVQLNKVKDEIVKACK